MEMGNKISYKIDKSLQVYYGRILEFKLDKIKVTKCKYRDLWGHWDLSTWIDIENILTNN